MKRLTALIPLVALVIGLLLLGLPDTAGSIAATNIPDNEVASSVGEAEKSDSTSVRITIMMYALPLEGEDNR